MSNNDELIAALQEQVRALQAQVDGLETIVARLRPLAQHVTLETGELNKLPGPHLIFHKVNVHRLTALPRMRVGKISESSTQGKGPKPREWGHIVMNMTKTTRGPTIFKWKTNPANVTDPAMQAEAISQSGRRPIRSISQIAITVRKTLPMFIRIAAPIASLASG